ncbi:MAG: universal stress protein [Thermodesulfobacteriota bacterium]
MAKKKRFLLPVDGSECSMNAAKYAIEMAGAAKAAVEVIHCYEKIPAIMPDTRGKYLKEYKSLLIAEANKLLEVYQKLFEETKLTVKIEAVEGSPGKVIYDLAKSKKYDLIIMGSKGHSEVGGLFMGSVTRKVLTNVFCPVLIVP